MKLTVSFVTLIDNFVVDLPIENFKSIIQSSNANGRADKTYVASLFEFYGRGQINIKVDDDQIYRFSLISHRRYRASSGVSNGEINRWLNDLRKQFKESLYDDKGATD